MEQLVKMQRTSLFALYEKLTTPLAPSNRSQETPTQKNSGGCLMSEARRQRSGQASPEVP